MATFERTCEQCGTSFTSPRSQARFCGPTCRSRAHRGKPGVEAVEANASSEDPPATRAVAAKRSKRYSTLEEQVRATLTEMKALTTISGMSAVRVAQQIDRGGDSGSAVATLSKELSRLVSEAKVEAAPLNADKVDDVAALVNAKILRLAQ